MFVTLRVCTTKRFYKFNTFANIKMVSFEELATNRLEIMKLAQLHGASNIRVFGSVARGEASKSSDVDLLVKMEPGRSLLDLIGFEQELSDLLGVKVQAISEGGISRHLKDRIFEEAKPL